MRKNWLMLIAVMLIVPGLLMTAGCSKKAVVETSSATDEKGPSQAEMDKAKMDEEARKAEEQRQAELARLEAEARAQAEAAEQAKMAAMDRIAAEDVYFEFDSAVLSPIAQDTLRYKAEFMVANPSAFMLIEGHCDERGTAEYNTALGERRAQAVKDFLVDLGVNQASLTTVSYGEEKPVDPGHTEAAWAKNRRAHTVVQ